MSEDKEEKQRLIPNPAIKLRDYQVKQVNFARYGFAKSNVIGIESSTGSGKSIVTMDIAMKYLIKNPDKQVLFASGFNHLVYQMEKTALDYGFPQDMIQVIMGRKRINCPIEWAKENPGQDYKPFTEHHYQCTEDHLQEGQTICAEASKRYKKILIEVTTGQVDEDGFRHKEGKLIITNDSMALIFINKIDPSLFILDEAHTFNNFYQSYMQQRISPSIMKRTNEVITSNKILRDAFQEAIHQQKPLSNSIYNLLESKAREDFMKRRFEQRDRIAAKNADIEEARELVKSSSNISAKIRRLAELETRPLKNNRKIVDLVNQAIDEVNILSIQDDYDKYINVDENNYYVENFYNRFDKILDNTSMKTLIVSATIDKFTQMMFDMQDHEIYREQKKFVDFTKSKFLLFPNNKFSPTSWNDIRFNLNKFLEYVKNDQSGLLLFTTNANMRAAYIELNHIYGFTFFKDKEEFEQYEGKKILIGSKALFQGIDIPNLDFVAMDKYPVPSYDEHEQKMQEFLSMKNSKFNPWTHRTIPLTVNDVIQGTGRLWRSVNSYGTIAILDPRYTGWIKNIIKLSVLIPRHGINSYVFVDDKFITLEDYNEIDIQKREEENKIATRQKLLKMYPQLSEEDKIHDTTKIVSKKPLIVEIGGIEYTQRQMNKLIDEAITFVEINAVKQFILVKSEL